MVVEKRVLLVLYLVGDLAHVVVGLLSGRLLAMLLLSSAISYSGVPSKRTAMQLGLRSVRA